MIQTGQILNEDQAADLLGVRPQTLATWRCHGSYDLPYVKIGRLVKYRLTDLEEWIESRVVMTDR